MADNVSMRDYNGLAPVPMRTTDKGTAQVPHHIVDDVVKLPIISNGPALVSNLIAATGVGSLIECNAHFTADGYLFIFDLAAMPADGNRLPLTVPKKIFADTWYNFRPRCPLPFVNGCVLAYSSAIISGTAYQFTHGSFMVADAAIGDVWGAAL